MFGVQCRKSTTQGREQIDCGRRFCVVFCRRDGELFVLSVCFCRSFFIFFRWLSMVIFSRSTSRVRRTARQTRWGKRQAKACVCRQIDDGGTGYHGWKNFMIRNFNFGTLLNRDRKGRHFYSFHAS